MIRPRPFLRVPGISWGNIANYPSPWKRGPVVGSTLEAEFLSHLKLAFYWGSKILLAFVKHVKKDPPKGFPNWRNGLSGLLLIKLEIGSYVDQVTGFKKSTYYWARGFSKPISHLTRWKQERLGFLHFRSERILAYRGPALWAPLGGGFSINYLTWMKKDSKPEAFSSSLMIFLVSAPWEHTLIFVDEIPFFCWKDKRPEMKD